MIPQKAYTAQINVRGKNNLKQINNFSVLNKLYIYSKHFLIRHLKTAKPLIKLI